MEDEDIEKKVIAYLKKKGFKHIELALQEDQNRLSPPSSTQIDTRLKSGPARYHDGYSKLRSWAYSSLDLYRMTKTLASMESMTLEEAKEHAQRIEGTCFVTADEHYLREPYGDGTDAVQIYAREAKKLMLQLVKEK